jgi:hypothetical protein
VFRVERGKVLLRKKGEERVTAAARDWLPRLRAEWSKEESFGEDTY